MIKKGQNRTTNVCISDLHVNKIVQNGTKNEIFGFFGNFREKSQKRKLQKICCSKLKKNLKKKIKLFWKFYFKSGNFGENQWTILEWANNPKKSQNPKPKNLIQNQAKKFQKNTNLELKIPNWSPWVILFVLRSEFLCSNWNNFPPELQLA